jgi:hypothetical protein
VNKMPLKRSFNEKLKSILQACLIKWILFFNANRRLDGIDYLQPGKEGTIADSPFLKKLIF